MNREEMEREMPEITRTMRVIVWAVLILVAAFMLLTLVAYTRSMISDPAVVVAVTGNRAAFGAVVVPVVFYLMAIVGCLIGAHLLRQGDTRWN